MKKIISSIPFKYALATTAGLIAYFGIARLLGFADNYALRFLNAGIMFGGVFFSIKKYKEKKQGMLNYLNGIGIGLQTTAYTSILFTASVLLYSFIDPAFLNSVIEAEAYMGATSIYLIAGLTALESAGSGFLFTYASMQYLKESRKSEEKDAEAKDFASKFSEQTS